MKKLPARLNRYAVPLGTSFFMTFLVSGVATYRALGWGLGVLETWMVSWMISWAVAFPTMLVMMPVVQRALSPGSSTRLEAMPDLRRGNLFAPLPRGGAAELVEVLAEGAGLRIDRIVSTGQASPPGFWYDQPGDEFVVLLAGSAVLRFEEGDRRFDLQPGDWIEIPAHVRHRVEFTQADPPTVWLAVHGVFTAARAGA